MARRRIKLSVYVDLDPVPGAFHSAESARNHVNALLYAALEHYNPIVSIESWNTNPSVEED
jgi:hypothetical protein